MRITKPTKVEIMNKQEIIDAINEKSKSHGNLLNWLRNVNKDKASITKNKELLKGMYEIFKEDNSVLHPYYANHFQYYCKKWYKLPYITKDDTKGKP